ncbi:MAG: amidohydrolase family protein, partial [Chitinophagaceae bacterium]
FGWQVYQAFQQYFPNQTALVPHAPYSVSSTLLHKLKEVTHPNSIISIHNQESADENIFFETGEGSFRYLYNCLQVPIDDFFRPTGLTSLASVMPQLPAANNCILVHNSFTTKADIELIHQKQAATTTHFCICANANLYIENCLPNIPLLHSSGIPIVIGTDSLASNHQLSIISELIAIQNGFPELNTTLLLNWATCNGAKALGIDNWAGSFEKGKKPGIVLLEGMNQNSFLKETSNIKVIK